MNNTDSRQHYLDAADSVKASLRDPERGRRGEFTTKA